jgi:hypothetical protein
MSVLNIAILENAESVDKGVMTVLVTKVEILLYFVQNIPVILLQFHQIFTIIRTLSDRDYVVSRVGYHSPSVLSSSEMIAFSCELYVACPLLKLLK